MEFTNINLCHGMNFNFETKPINQGAKILKNKSIKRLTPCDARSVSSTCKHEI